MTWCGVVFLVCVTLCSAGSVDEFLTWFQENGGKANGVTVAEVPGMGLGVVASSKINNKDVVLEVPMPITLGRDTLTNDPLFPSYRKFKTVDDAMVAWLLIQRELDDDSKWAPYIRVLPERVPVCLYFSKKQLKLLGVPQHEKDCKEMRAKQEAMFSEFRDVFQALLAEAVPSSALVVKFDDYLWGKTILWSRAWMMEGKRILVPFADMFNYSPLLTANRAANHGQTFLEHHKIDTASNLVTILSDRECEMGEQLFEDYGDSRNIIYLINHGFVPDVNPFNTAPVPVSSLLRFIEKPQESQARERLLRLVDVETIEIGDMRRMHSHHSSALVTAAQVITAPINVVEKCTSEVQNNPDQSWRHAHDVLSMCLSRHHLNVRLASLVPEIEHFMQNTFTTSIADDQKLLASLDAESFDAIAIRHRIAHKTVLETFVQQHKGHLRDSRTGNRTHPDNLSKEALELYLKNLLEPLSETEFDQAVKDFNGWAKRNTRLFPVNHLKVQKVPNMGLGTVARTDIKSESLYISVADEAILSEQQAHNDKQLGPVLTDLAKRFGSNDNFHSLLFLLLVEVAKGPDSRWDEYLRILPRDFSHNPVMFTAEQLDMLKGSAVLTRIQTRIGTIKSKYAKMKSLVFSHYNLLGWVTYEHYLWAHLILDSRSIWWHSKRHLVPMLDMINCNELSADMRVHETTFNTKTQTADTLAPTAFASGAQVFENYGQANHVYFLYHGFSLPSNSHDCVLMDLSRVSGEAGTFECFHADLKHIPPRILHALEQNSPSHSPALLIQSLAKKQLARYSTTIEEDEEMLREGKLGSVERAIVEFRLSEKRILGSLATPTPKHDEL